MRGNMRQCKSIALAQERMASVSAEHQPADAMLRLHGLC
jgi:hypothetical protein